MATKKNTVKRKTSGRSMKRTPRRVAASNPVSKSHETLVRTVARGVVAVDTLAEKARVAEKHAEEAIAHAREAVQKARKTQTAAAKRLVAQARTRAQKARARLGEWRAKFRHEERKLKGAVSAAEFERRKEEAKQKAVAAFTAKWERDWERRQAKKTTAKKKTARRRTTAPPSPSGSS